jgi:hypothetical protein
VLLSHDHHFDNLDHAGRSLLTGARRVLTTVEGAERLGGTAVGLTPWQRTDLPAPGGAPLIVTATPARHGPEHGDRGPVIGFALAFSDQPEHVVYISGDTVWYDGVHEVARRFTVTIALPNLGAAKISAAGGRPLTFTAADAVELARHSRSAHRPAPFRRLGALHRVPRRGRARIYRRRSWKPSPLAASG